MYPAALAAKDLCYLGHKLLRTFARARRDAHYIVTVRQLAEILVALVEYHYARRLARVQALDELVYDVYLLFQIRAGDVRDMQQHVGVLQLFQRGLEGLDQVSEQFANEADSVREQHFLRLVKFQAAGGGVQGVEKTVVGLYIAAGELI